MRYFCILVASLLLATSTISTTSAEELLTIGSDAPKLDIEHWVQNGNGKFKPVTSFEKGKVYIVEFWATWCGPCVQSMPHLAQLQTEYADKGVQLISVSDEDLETVEKFLDREVRKPKNGEAKEGEKAQTYRELTSVYCLTTDPDASTSRDYMEAAKQNGIPTSFIVGKDGKIDWIGHPMEIDTPLIAVIEDKWDRVAFGKEMKARQEAEAKMQEIFALFQGRKFKEAIKLIDEVIASTGDLQFRMMKLQILLASGDSDQAATYTETLFKDLADKPEVINMLAWNIYELTAQGQIKSDKLLDSALTSVEKAVQKAKDGEKASIMDTLAHILAQKGEVAKALEVEKEAIKTATEQDKAFMQKFLAELQEKLDEKKEEKKDK